MRIRGMLYSLVLAATAGCATVAEEAAAPPSSPDDAAAGVQTVAYKPGDQTETDKLKNTLTPDADAAAPKTTLADWQWPKWGNKDTQALEELQKKYDQLEAQSKYDAYKLWVRDSQIDIVKQSFYYLKLTWVKKSLYNLCANEKDKLAKGLITENDAVFTHFNSAGEHAKDKLDCKAILPPRTGTLERDLAYDRAVVNAVKDFQCDFHAKTSTSACDEARATGWITYEEARKAVCRAGYAAKDDVAITLAEWLKEGQVYWQNLYMSHAMIEKLKTNLKAMLSPEGRENLSDQEIQYYLDIEADAREFAYRLQPSFDAKNSKTFADIAHEFGLLKWIIQSSDKITADDFSALKYDFINLFAELPYRGGPTSEALLKGKLDILESKIEKSSDIAVSEIEAIEQLAVTLRKEIEHARYAYVETEVCRDLFITKLDYNENEEKAAREAAAAADVSSSTGGEQ